MSVVLFYYPSMRSSLLYSDYISEYPDLFSLVVQVPILSPSRLTGRMNYFKIVERVFSNIKMSFFFFIVITYYNILSYLFGTNLKRKCSSHNIPHMKISNNDVSLISILKKIDPEFIVSSTSMLLNEDILKLPKFGVINFHEGKVPQYRGSASYFWCLLNQDKDATATTMLASYELDAGPILNEVVIETNPHRTVFSIWFALLKAHKSSWNFLLPLLKNNRLPKSTVQTTQNAKTYSFPIHDDTIKLNERGIKILTIKEIFVVTKFAITGRA